MHGKPIQTVLCNRFTEKSKFAPSSMLVFELVSGVEVPRFPQTVFDFRGEYQAHKS